MFRLTYLLTYSSDGVRFFDMKSDFKDDSHDITAAASRVRRCRLALGGFAVVGYLQLLIHSTFVFV